MKHPLQPRKLKIRAMERFLTIASSRLSPAQSARPPAAPLPSFCYMPFEGEQEQAYEEEFQQLAKEGKWTSPPAYFIFVPIIAW